LRAKKRRKNFVFRLVSDRESLLGALFERHLDDLLRRGLRLARCLVVMLVFVIFFVVLVLTWIVTFGELMVVMLGDALEMGLELAMTLLARKRANLHVDVTPGHFRFLVALAHRFKVFLDLAGEQMAELLMGHLAAAELELDAHFVPFGEEVFGMSDLDEVIVRVDADTELHLLHLAALLMLVGFLFVLLLDVLKFAVVDDLAHGRIGLRSHLHEVQTALTGNAQRLMRGQDAKLMLPVFLDDTHFRRTDALVDAIQLVGVTTTVAITTAGAAWTISSLATTSTEGARSASALTGWTVLRRAGRDASGPDATCCSCRATRT